MDTLNYTYSTIILSVLKQKIIISIMPSLNGVIKNTTKANIPFLNNSNKAEINYSSLHNAKLVSKHEILKKESMIESTRDKSGDR